MEFLRDKATDLVDSASDIGATGGPAGTSVNDSNVVRTGDAERGASVNTVHSDNVHHGDTASVLGAIESIADYKAWNKDAVFGVAAEAAAFVCTVSRKTTKCTRPGHH